MGIGKTIQLASSLFLPLDFLLSTFHHRPCNDIDHSFHPFAPHRNPPCPATTLPTKAGITTSPATTRRNSSKVATAAHHLMASLNRTLTTNNNPDTAGIRNNTKAMEPHPRLPTGSRTTSSKAHTAHRSTAGSSMDMTSRSRRVVSTVASSRSTGVSHRMANKPHPPPATLTTPMATPATP